LFSGVLAFNKYNCKESMTLEEAEQAAVLPEVDEAQAQALVAHRQKLIRFAGSSDLDWKHGVENETNLFADDSDDKCRIFGQNRSEQET
jgi:hypothetical protein